MFHRKCLFQSSKLSAYLPACREGNPSLVDKEQRRKWKYLDGDTTCDCGLATENTEHVLQFTLLARPCTLYELSRFNDTAKSCVERWKTTV